MLSRLVITDTFFANQEKRMEAEKNSVNDTEVKSVESKAGRFNTKILQRRATDRESNENGESGAI